MLALILFISMDKIAEFVNRKHKPNVHKTEIKEIKTPWYRRPIEREAFSVKESKKGEFYAQHNEWSKRVWIGPYASMNAVNKIIDAYIEESLKGTLAKKTMESIHSVIVEDYEQFFKG